MEEIYLERIKRLETKIKELRGETDEPIQNYPEPEDDEAKLSFDGKLLTIEYTAFDDKHIVKLDPFINHNVPDFIAACINYFRWDNALYDDNKFEEIISLEDETIRYKNFKSMP